MHDNEFKLCAAIVVLGLVSVAGPSGCDRGKSTSRGPVPEPPIVRGIRLQGEEAAVGKTGKDGAAAWQSAVRAAFQGALADGHQAEIERFVEAVVKTGDSNGTAYELQADLVLELMSKPDKAELARVLAWGSTDHSSYWSIESSLTMPDMPWNKLPDGLDVLFDAYELAKTAEAKDANYFAVWRALGDLPIKTKNQDEYMRVTRPWYHQNRDRLQRQRGYDHTDFYYGPRETMPSDSRRHLFALPDPTSR